MISYEKQISRLTDLLAGCHEKQFWGKITLQLVNGNIVAITPTQTVKLDSEEEILCVKQKANSESPSEPSLRSPEI